MTVLLDEENRAQTLIAEPGSLNQAPVVVTHGGKGPPETERCTRT